MAQNHVDGKGKLIEVGKKAKVRIACGEIKSGVVELITQKQTTIRSQVTKENPDGYLYGVPHNDVTME